jgi:hypothetical protein
MMVARPRDPSPASGDGHAVERRTMGRQDDRTWVGTLVCSCGWTLEVGPYAQRSIVSETLASSWAGHHQGKAETR